MEFFNKIRLKNPSETSHLLSGIRDYFSLISFRNRLRCPGVILKKEAMSFSWNISNNSGYLESNCSYL